MADGRADASGRRELHGAGDRRRAGRAIDRAGRVLAPLAVLIALSALRSDARQPSGLQSSGEIAPPTEAVSYTIAAPPPAGTAFTPQQTATLEKLNRVDAAHMDRLTLLVIPDLWLNHDTAYSPLPLTSPWAAAHAKALIVHQPSQVFGAYAGGQLIRWGPVSSGRKAHPTPSGMYHLNWRSRGRSSTIDPDWFMRWYFNFQNDRGLAFHEYALPGRPASHACVRLLARDAKWLFDWGEGWVLDERCWEVIDPGTPVWIVGQYDFGAPPPWRSLNWLGEGITLPFAAPTLGHQR